MSNVIPFPLSRRERANDVAPDERSRAATADILLFLGVRYERHGETGTWPSSAEPARSTTQDQPGRKGGPSRSRKSRRRA